MAWVFFLASLSAIWLSVRPRRTRVIEVSSFDVVRALRLSEERRR